MSQEPGDTLDAPLLHAVLAAFPNGSVNVFDCNLRYVFTAGRGLAEVGLSPEMLVGRTLDELYDPSLVALVMPHYTRALGGEQTQFEFDAFSRTYHMSAAPVVPVEGSIAHIVVVTQDITERKQRETAMRDNEERRRVAEAALRALDRQKDAFISTLAHELRQPLGAMTAAVELIKVSHPDIAPTTPIAVLRRQLDHVQRLLDDLVDASKLVRGHVALAREPLDLREVLRSALETVMPAVAERELHLIVTLGDVPLVVEGDRTRLQQVFSNLLDNAAKYGRRQGRIWVHAAQEGDQTTVSVRDDGVGIAADVLPHVFELFTQAPEHDRGGIGVGLAVVRSLVAAHGGAIDARSAGVDQGSEFLVRLPAADD